jgi:agmatinase
MQQWPENAFLDLDPELARRTHARFVILPIPYEQTTTYKQGCARGPDAIIEASAHLENFDEQLQRDFHHIGIHTHPHFLLGTEDADTALAKIHHTALKVFAEGKIPLSLGGEHSITAPLAQAARKLYPKLSLLHFDAHADLRDTYQGSKYNHACVMHRIFDMDVPFVSVGLRLYCLEEFEFMQKHHIPYFSPEEVADSLTHVTERILEFLTEQVYITFDIDALDLSVAPGTGTPDPGGLTYRQSLAILEAVGRHKHIVGADIVEVMPIPPNHITEFTAARIAYKIIAYAQLSS